MSSHEKYFIRNTKQKYNSFQVISHLFIFNFLKTKNDNTAFSLNNFHFNMESFLHS